MSGVNIRRINPGEERKALRLTLPRAHQSAPEIERHVTAFLQYAREMSLDVSLQWCCEINGRMTAAVTCMESPGRTAMLLLPSHLDPQSETAVFNEILPAIIEHEARRDFRLLQSLLELNEHRNRHLLEALGFWQIAELHYLERRLLDADVFIEQEKQCDFSTQEWKWIHYDSSRHLDFARLISATYQDSLDCQGLSDLRDIEDVLTGHKGVGRFDPQRWRLLLHNDDPAACILFGENPLQPIWELVYMGVHPKHRGRGLGHYVLTEGLAFAYRQKSQAVTLAVDARNTPARRLYESCGFTQTCARRAMMYRIGITPSPV